MSSINYCFMVKRTRKREDDIIVCGEVTRNALEERAKKRIESSVRNKSDISSLASSPTEEKT